MTSLLCWAGRDTHLPLASIYIATDSRITWGTANWDLGRKTFASVGSPDVFGYCGDVVFPALVLSQFVSALDEGLYPTEFEARTRGLETLLRVSLKAVPVEQRNPFSVLHCGRDGSLMASTFHARLLTWGPKSGWERCALQLPDITSDVVHVDGSGHRTVIAEIDRWKMGPSRGTTRGLFGAFVSAIDTGEDARTGGAPQMVGLFRKGNGQSFGVLYRGKRFLYGMPSLTTAPHRLSSDSETEQRSRHMRPGDR